jgi:membrane protease YdiL (CAAX protease family)
LTILLAIVTGVAVLVTGNWVALLVNLQVRGGATVPWSILAVAIYLWAWWQFLSGKWAAADGGETRRTLLRANRVPRGLWLPALGAGLLGFTALLALLSLAARVVDLPEGTPIATPAGMPVVTVVLLLTTQSIIAGVTEEAAFRGYMQSLIERRHGLLLAILINGILFGLLHFGNHPRDVLLMLPYYVAVAAVYGGLTWATDSILPALVLHSAGDVVVLVRWWATGLPEWQLSRGATPGSSITLTIVLVVLSLAAVLAYGKVHALRVMTVLRSPREKERPGG